MGKELFTVFTVLCRSGEQEKIIHSNFRNSIYLVLLGSGNTLIQNADFVEVMELSYS